MRGINKVKTDQKLRSLVVLLTAALLLVMVTAMTGCVKPSEQKPSEQKSSQVKAPGQVKIPEKDQIIQAVRVLPEVTKNDEAAISTNLRIPQISGMKNVEIQKSINKALAERSLQLLSENTQDARAFYEETKKTGDHFWKYDVTVDYAVHYNQNGILSLTIDNYQFTGGAHGGTERLPFNIDLNTGEFLALQDLFTPGFAYQSIIDDEVGKEIAKYTDGFFEGEEGFNGIGDNRTYYLIPGYIVVYFAQYEIAPYSTGMPEFKIPMERFGASIDQRLLKK